jgi:hypothetical protein
MARFKFNLFPMSPTPPRRVTLDEARDKPRGLGTFAKLPLEIRTRIWVAWVKDESPLESYTRLQRLSRWMAFESYHILMARRCLTFDLSSYEQAPGHWISEFYVHDQYGCRWRVAPQFGGMCGTLEGAENLDVVCSAIIGLGGDGEHPPTPMRIRVSAPQDAGEMLVLWNRMRWIAHFLHRHAPFFDQWDEADYRRIPKSEDDSDPSDHEPTKKPHKAVNLRFEFLETHDRSWWEPSTAKVNKIRRLLKDFSPILTEDNRFTDFQYGETLAIHLCWGDLRSFALSPFIHWKTKARLRFRRPDHVHERIRQPLKSFHPSLSLNRRIYLRRESSTVCPQWPRHLLDVVDQTRSTDFLRLEMLASIDARRNETFLILRDEQYSSQGRCRTCVDQRNAASAYAPRDRDEMLQKIEKKMAYILAAESWDEKDKRRQKAYATHKSLISERSRYSSFSKMLSFPARLPTLHEPYDERDPIGPAYYYSESLTHYSSATKPGQLTLDCLSDSSINEAFKGAVEDPVYGFPEEVRSIQNYWQALGHWLKEHPNGIPSPASAEHVMAMQDFQNRHVYHPYEICSCKGTAESSGYGCFCNDVSMNKYSQFEGFPSEEELGDPYTPEQLLCENFDYEQFDFAIPHDKFPYWARRWRPGRRRRHCYWI